MFDAQLCHYIIAVIRHGGHLPILAELIGRVGALRRAGRDVLRALGTVVLWPIVTDGTARVPHCSPSMRPFAGFIPCLDRLETYVASVG